MKNNKKEKSNHHDNITIIETEYEYLKKDFEYTRNKLDQDFRDIKYSRNRVVDMQIDNNDKLIDLEIFFLKLFIPVLGISFAIDLHFFVIDVNLLRWLSLIIIVLTSILIILTYKIRKQIINSEQKHHESEIKELKMVTLEKLEKMKNIAGEIDKNVKKSFKDEKSLYTEA